jgi:hypothetical protein
MTNEEQEQQYEIILGQRMEGLTGEQHSFAQLLVEMSKGRYIEEADMNQCKAFMEKQAASIDQLLDGTFLTITKQLLRTDLGNVLGHIISHALEYPYSKGYARRPFRTNVVNNHLEVIIQKTISLIMMDRYSFQLSEYLTKADYTITNSYFTNQVIGDMISYELDQGNTQVIDALKTIIYGDNQTALLQNEMIKGIFMCHQEDMYPMIGELLIAARLQEGLRQSIVETMDSGTIEAYLYMLKIIINEGYIRYSSVVRALSVWIGMELESANQRVALQLIQQAHQALTEPDIRERWINSSNSNEVYIALWATAVYEEEDLYVYIQQLMKQGQHYQKIVAMYVLSNSTHKKLSLRLARENLEATDPELQYWVLMNYDYRYYPIWRMPGTPTDGATITFERDEALEDKAERQRDFERLLLMFDRMDPQYSAISKALDFVHVQFNSDLPVQIMLYLAAYDMDSTWLAELISRKGKFSPNMRGEILSHFMSNKEHSDIRAFILDSLTDKSMNNREHALEQIKDMTLVEEELRPIEELLKLKSGSLRQSTIKVLLLQPEERLVSSLTHLLKAKNELQRLGALEILSEIVIDEARGEQLERLRPLAQLITNPSAKEKALLNKLVHTSGVSRADGFGLFDPKVTEPWLLEKKAIGDFSFRKDIFTLTFDKIESFIVGLDQLVHQYRDVEYVSEYYSGYKDTLLIGTYLRELYPYRQPSNSDEDFSRLERYPLHEQWREYWNQSNIKVHELMQLYYLSILPDLDRTLDSYYHYHSFHGMEYHELQKHRLLEGWRKLFLEEAYPLDLILKVQSALSKLTYNNQVMQLIQAFFYDSNKEEAFVWTELAVNKLTQLTDELEQDNKLGLFQLITSPWLQMQRSRVYDQESFKVFYRTVFAYDQLLEAPDKSSSFIFEERIRAFEEDIIGEGELYKAILDSGDSPSYLWSITASSLGSVEDRTKLLAIRNSVVDRIVSIELLRGDLATDVTSYVNRLQRIEGMDYFVRLLAGLDQDAFVRGYVYSYNNALTKKEAFSHLLKNCHPKAGEDAARLHTLLKEHPSITDKKLLEAAMYAPQWIDIVAEHLGWEGLRSAAWYFHAHINESFSAEKETVVARYSPITPQDFNDGAFDIGWFKEAYETLGEQRFNLLYECAKYISAGANHRRSQLFADATLGKLKLEAMLTSVTDKRNKDHLLSYSLIPLESDREQDLRNRYDFIQQFLLQSKKFGAQRRASESITSQIALDNLARNAGYKDLTRLKWDMEARKLDEMKTYFEPYYLDDETTVQLVVDEEGQTDIQIYRKGKELKAIPAKYKKEEYVVTLKEMKSDLIEQYRRARKELERSMELSNSFTSKELVGLDNNPVIRPLISSLVFKSGDQFGYFDGEALSLRDSSGTLTTLMEEDHLLIAHPVHLYESGQWSSFQRDLFDRQIRQPFKQVFRELYMPNSDELLNGAHSRRYAGYQVQPKKTVALLKGRQWTVSYEDGLQKVFHAENLIVSLYAMADWFSPSDTEAPTLEIIQFMNRSTYEPVPLDQVPPILFSEVMRDVDLVVSVAHIGGVDPEASLTTIEMRQAIVQESLRLLRLSNVRLDGSYAHITGSLGEYAVHLGSGMVYKQASGALHIIPVHSQHRGRIFLPFLDEDPKTAEIMSKIVLLAEDTKIKDPQILLQLKK